MVQQWIRLSVLDFDLWSWCWDVNLTELDSLPGILLNLASSQSLKIVRRVPGLAVLPVVQLWQHRG